MPAATLIFVGRNISGAGFLRHLAWIFYNTPETGKQEYLF